MKKGTNLSNRQNDILTFIKKYIAKNGTSPSVREIAAGVHLNSPATVHVHLQNLIEKGYLKRNLNNHKLLELTSTNEFELNEGDAINVPLIDKIVIRNLDDELKNPDKYFYLSTRMIPNGCEIFMLIVQDDTVSNIGIFEDDYLIVEKIDRASDGDIVFFLNDDSEISFKVFSQQEDMEIDILGKVISLYREL